MPFLRQMLYEAAYWRGGNRPDLEAGLSTPEFRKSALHLYETLGFKTVGTFGNAYTMVVNVSAPRRRGDPDVAVGNQ